MPHSTIQPFITQILQEKRLTLHINPQELKRFPTNEPFTIICNQLEDVDEWALLQIIAQLKTSVKIINPKRSYKPPELKRLYFLSNYQPLFSIPELSSRLRSLLEEAVVQVDDNTSLALAIDFRAGRLEGIRRNRQVRKMLKTIKNLKRPIVPIHLVPGDEPTLLNQFKPKIIKRLAGTPAAVTVRIGNPIAVEEQQAFENSDRFRKFIQSKIFALGTNLEVKPFFFNPLNFIPRSGEQAQEPIIEPVPTALIEQEIQQLTFKNLIASRLQFDVLVASATEIPHTMQEIGRLRETTFRGVGEGTGKSLDLDEYDLYYKQLIIWDREQKKIVGGYRIGEGDFIFRQYGVEGFYIQSLFKIEEGFFPIMQQSVELGRSYIVPEYQKQRLPLFLLWKGILFFLLQNPQYRYLYGPLSISKNYSSVSKSVIVEFIKRYYYKEELAQYLKPRKPFKVRTEKVNIDVLMETMGDQIKSLDTFIEDIESEHFTIPVLLKQYVKLNARFISFNVDPNFSDVLDGFIILDLNDVPISMIEALKKEG